MMALFTLKLSAGITLMWLLMPRKEVTDGFFRIQMRVLLGLTVLAALMLAAGTTWPVEAEDADSQAAVEAIRVSGWVRTLCISAAVFCYFGTVFWALGRRFPGNICIFALTVLCVAALACHSWHVPSQIRTGHQLFSDFSSAALLGAVLTGMLLGHWYLTTPAMSIQPIWWFNKAIAVAVVLRLAASAWTAIEYGVSFAEPTQQIWLALRWLAGIAGPAVMAIMVWRILKHRNTQSATGVLFAGLILVFMGEMTAALLERDIMVPY